MTNITTQNWTEVKIHFGKKSGTKLGDLSPRDLAWWKTNWQPNSQFCKSKLTERFNIPAWIEREIEDDDDTITYTGEVILHPAGIGTRRIADPINCPDCALRAALDAAEMPVPKIIGETITGIGEHVGSVGDKVTVTDAVVEKVMEFESEFNRKKTISTIAILRNGEVFKVAVSPTMGSFVEGMTVTLTGTVKGHGDYEGERFTSLIRCKVENVVKLTPTHGIELFCDAKSSRDQIAVCAADGSPLEYGPAGLGTPRNGDNTDHELAGAMLALDIARRVKEGLDADCIAVKLNFDAQWMKGMVGKAKPLRDFAKLHKLVVTMNQIAGIDNPADEWTTASGAKTFVVNADEIPALTSSI